MCLTACALLPGKSDEELINDRLEEFLTAYNAGDWNATLDCLDAKTRNTYKSLANITDMFIGKAGLDLKLSDLFGLSVGLASKNNILTLSDITIDIYNDTDAIVYATMNYSDSLSDLSETVSFNMVKENGNWFIKNMQSK